MKNVQAILHERINKPAAAISPPTVVAPHMAMITPSVVRTRPVIHITKIVLV